jgi:hypothetical protein
MSRGDFAREDRYSGKPLHSLYVLFAIFQHNESVPYTHLSQPGMEEPLMSYTDRQI